MNEPIEQLNISERLLSTQMASMQNKLKALQSKTGAGISKSQNKKQNINDMDAEDIKLKETAKEFEKIFVNFMIKDMWKTIKMDEEKEKIPGEDIYMEMMQSALAGEIVKGQGLGISKMLYDKMKTGMLAEAKAAEKLSE